MRNPFEKYPDLDLYIIYVILALSCLVLFSTEAKSQTTIASYYGAELHGRRTASGERFNKNAMTAAHRTLPFGTHVRVTNLRNGRQVVVRINDRGPFVRRRGIDLSHGAARRIGLPGVGPVRLERQ